MIISNIENTYPYQLEGVRMISKFNGRVLLADEMGLGKTRTSLLWALPFVERLPTIVVCPALVKYHWEHEANILGCYSTVVLEGRNVSHLQKAHLYIVNYDILKNWLDSLKEKKPKTLIIDECQYCANNTQRTKVTRNLSRSVENVLALSGTPLSNRPIELFNALNMINPKVFSNRWSFAHKYCGPRLTPWGWKFEGATNLPELRSLLKTTVMVRRRKSEVLKDLPKLSRKIITLALSNPSEYEKADQDFIGWLTRQNPSKVKGALRATALVKINYMKQLAARYKLKGIIEWVNQWLKETNEKLAIFATHRKMIEALERRCEAKSIVIDGSVSSTKRHSLIQQFQTDAGTRLMIGNIQAAGIGITLTAASTGIVAELPWRPGDLLQLEKRLDRLGQTKPVTFLYMIAYGTVEEKICGLLQRKQRTLSTVLDGGEEDNFSMFDELIKGLSK